jgi:hypothetical protein
MLISAFSKIMLITLISVSTKMVPRVPSKIRLNMEKLLADYPSGIPSELIPHLYKVCIYMYIYVCICRPVFFVAYFLKHI